MVRIFLLKIFAFHVLSFYSWNSFGGLYSSYERLTMGFFELFVTVVFQFFPFTWRDNSLIVQQQPLPLDVSSHGVVFEPQDISVGIQYGSPQKETQKKEFVCKYPSLVGWELCNGPDSRDCWLRNTRIKQPIFSQFDVQTDYEDVWPPGITREVFTIVPACKGMR